MTVAAVCKGPLARIHYWILGGWTTAVVVLTIGILWSSRDAQGWEGLVAIVGFMFLGASVLILIGATLVARFFVTGRSARTVTVAVLPPAVFALLLGLTAAS